MTPRVRPSLGWIAAALGVGCITPPQPSRESLATFALHATRDRATAGDPRASCYAFLDAGGAIEEWSVDSRSGASERFDDLDRQLLRRVESEGGVVISAVKAVHRPTNGDEPASIVLRIRDRQGPIEERRYPLGPGLALPTARDVVIGTLETPGFEWP